METTGRSRIVACTVLTTALALGATGWAGPSGAERSAASQATRSADEAARGGASEQPGAAARYERYCALCHGKDREGYANDGAPSLATKTLFGLGPIVPYNAIAYGRPGTTMGPYLDDLGGPMTMEEIRELAVWLSEQAGVPMKRPRPEMLEPVPGDVSLGREIYANHCASCHGENGQGGDAEQPATALANATMLATSPDAFLRLAIAEGREGTPMAGFEDRLSPQEIDAVTAFLRSRASGWDVPAEGRAVTPPAADEWVLNPDGPAPDFELRDGRYVSARDLHEALDSGRRLILLDTRVPYFWAMANIEGSVPIPYYSDFDSVVQKLPRDGTWIVTYCECPRAAASSVVTKLRQRGFEHTAALWEGYVGWTALGFPIVTGEVPGPPPAASGAP